MLNERLEGFVIAYPVTQYINPLNAKLNPICHLLALLGVHHILHISRIRVNSSQTLFSLNYIKLLCARILGLD